MKGGKAGGFGQEEGGRMTEAYEGKRYCQTSEEDTEKYIGIYAGKCTFSLYNDDQSFVHTWTD